MNFLDKLSDKVYINFGYNFQFPEFINKRVSLIKKRYSPNWSMVSAVVLTTVNSKMIKNVQYVAVENTYSFDRVFTLFLFEVCAVCFHHSGSCEILFPFQPKYTASEADGTQSTRYYLFSDYACAFVLKFKYWTKPCFFFAVHYVQTSLLLIKFLLHSSLCGKCRVLII